jgi:hypothetical protein
VNPKRKYLDLALAMYIHHGRYVHPSTIDGQSFAIGRTPRRRIILLSHPPTYVSMV